MGLFDRAKRAISSNVNALIDKAEDPRKMVDLTIEEMREQLGRARQDVIASVGAEKQLRKKADEQRQHVEKWEQRAMLAVQAGDDALAREALKQKTRAAEELSAIEARREEQLGIALKLRDDLKLMEQRIDTLSAKKGTIVARAEIAAAGGGVEGLGAKGGSGGNAFERFRGIEEKMEHNEAQVDAMRELEGDSMKEAELESKFRHLEGKGIEGSKSAAIDEELERLKTRVRVK